jgi:hypothetical protein
MQLDNVGTREIIIECYDKLSGMVIVMIPGLPPSLAGHSKGGTIVLAE